MKNLLLFSIGPVQSFIAQARKTHDLYAGSLLLSDLIKAAISVVGEKNVVFPAIGEAMPNRFVAWIPKIENDLNGFGQRVEAAVTKKWIDVSNAALEGLSEPFGFSEQISEHLEIFWVIEAEVKNYPDAMRNLEKNMAALKKIRPFKQYAWVPELLGERGRKCSLDGKRNVQFYRAANEKNDETESPLYAPKGSIKFLTNTHDAVLQLGEGLSAVSFVKRRYEQIKTAAFKSTAGIALLDALESLRNDPSNGLYYEFENRIFTPFNDQLFYEENVNSEFLKKHGISIKNGYDLLTAQNKRKTLESLCKMRFQKYYAILTFDGDNMGQWISGDLLTDQSKLLDFQEAFSLSLRAFASEAKVLLDNGNGRTAYAGGDDFVGFVNLNHLIPLLKALRSLFRSKVDAPLNSFKCKEITFSAGICIAHYKEPLTLVLQEAKIAQAIAKGNSPEGKNSFSISVIKGSGENHSIILPFGETECNINRFQLLLNALVKEEFSNNFIKTMRIEFERLMDFKDDTAAFQQVFRSELKRLLIRSANQDWSKEKKEYSAQLMMENLMELFGMRETENFFQILHIADFFQREVDAIKATENQTT